MEIVQPMLFLGSSSSSNSNIMKTSRTTMTLNLRSNNDDFLGSSTKAIKNESQRQVEDDDCGGVVVDTALGFENKKRIMQPNKKIRKHRYAFQTRSHVDVLDDGYRWRKYGQKSVKHYNFPRSYYKCTHQGCDVKKQIQRLSKDEEIVVTTYEGMHTHTTEKGTDNFEQILSQMMIYPSLVKTSA